MLFVLAYGVFIDLYMPCIGKLKLYDADIFCINSGIDMLVPLLRYLLL